MSTKRMPQDHISKVFAHLQVVRDHIWSRQVIGRKRVFVAGCQATNFLVLSRDPKRLNQNASPETL